MDTHWQVDRTGTEGSGSPTRPLTVGSTSSGELLRFVVAAVLALTFASSCTTVTAQTIASVRIERAPDDVQVLTYQGVQSFDATPVAIACLVTGIIYGGACWYYLLTPGPFDRAAANATAQSFVKSLGPCATIEGSPIISRVGFDAVPPTTRLRTPSGEMVPDAALNKLCGSRASLDDVQAEVTPQWSRTGRAVAKRDYNRFRDATTVAIPLPIDQGRAKEFNVLARGKGKTLGSDAKLAISLVFAESEWRFLECHTVDVLADGKPVEVGEATHEGKVVDGGVLELVVVPLTRPALDVLSTATMIELQVCREEFVLRPEGAARFKAMLDETYSSSDVAVPATTETPAGS